MKATSFGVILIGFVLSTTQLPAQQQYQGTLVTKLGDQQKVTITVNLSGPNEELVEISYSEKTKSKKSNRKERQTMNTSMKLNVAFIRHIIIHDTTYYFRDIKYDYNEKYYMNVCVKLIAGTPECGLFQTGNGQEAHALSIKLPNATFSKLVSVDFDYYKETLGWHIMGFGQCVSLRSKMEAKQEGYTWNDATTREQRLAMWKQWIREFNACTAPVPVKSGSSSAASGFKPISLYHNKIFPLFS